MKIFVATVNYLLLLDLKDNTVKVLECDRSEYYGISWWKENNDLVLSHSGIANDTLVNLKTYVASEKGYLSFGNKQSSTILSQPHQILCAPDNTIIATNTGRNSIVLYNTTNGFYKDIRVNDIHWDRLGKNNPCGEHFNSVFLKSNRLYVLAHRFNKGSSVFEFSYPHCELLNEYKIQHRTGLHNVWLDNFGNIFCCNSDTGELIEVKSNEAAWGSDAVFYARGLAATQDVIIIGSSEITAREKRASCKTGIWLINRKTMCTLDYYALGCYGSVHEVRIIDEPDEAHHGEIFTGLPKLEMQLAEKENLEKQEKLYLAQQWADLNKELKGFKTVVNGFYISEDNWVLPKKESFALSIVKTPPLSNYEISIDYSFPKSEGLMEQHLSLVVGYQGLEDSNMIAVLLYYIPQEDTVSLSLWKNKAGTWLKTEELFPIVKNTGKLSVKKIDNNKLKIHCDNLVPIFKEFEGYELKGTLGVRCLGGQFKNLKITE